MPQPPRDHTNGHSATIRDVYSSVTALRLEVREEFRDLRMRVESQEERLSTRVGRLESWRAYMAGAIALMAAAFPLVLLLLKP